jgi:hypothetical protein
MPVFFLYSPGTRVVSFTVSNTRQSHLRCVFHDRQLTSRVGSIVPNTDTFVLTAIAGVGIASRPGFSDGEAHR